MASRLQKIFEKFARDNDLPYKQNGQVWNLGIPVQGTIVQVRYHFSSSDDSYEFGATVGKVKQENLARTAQNIITSSPVRGITERIMNSQLNILGSRDGLRYQSDENVEIMFKDDAHRIHDSYEALKELIH
ncbi:MAG: hypothetical protein U0175_15140 [Caldilineaceae bacterium]